MNSSPAWQSCPLLQGLRFPHLPCCQRWPCQLILAKGWHKKSAEELVEVSALLQGSGQVGRVMFSLLAFPSLGTWQPSWNYKAASYHQGAYRDTVEVHRPLPPLDFSNQSLKLASPVAFAWPCPPHLFCLEVYPRLCPRWWTGARTSRTEEIEAST